MTTVEKKQSIASGRNYIKDLSKVAGAPVSDKKSENEKARASKEQRLEERRKSKQLDAKRRKKERESAKLESQIAEIEDRIKSIEAEMCRDDVFSDYSMVSTYSLKLQEAKDELETAYSRWMELQ